MNDSNDFQVLNADMITNYSFIMRDLPVCRYCGMPMKIYVHREKYEKITRYGTIANGQRITAVQVCCTQCGAKGPLLDRPASPTGFSAYGSLSDDSFVMQGVHLYTYGGRFA